MTFTEIKTEIKDRLGFSATDDDTRVGRAINRFYKEVTSSLGIKHTSRRTTVNASCSIGISTLEFTSAEKVVNVFNRNSTPYMQLDEVTVDELRSQMPFTASDTPSQYAISAIASDSVTILLNCIPQTAFALYADVYATKATLSGSDEPAFPESYHDLLVNGPLIDEYLKLEKPALSSKAEQRFKERLSELRHWIAVSTTKKEYQGKSTENAFGRVGGTSGGSGSVNGSLSYTQTGLITFDRSSAGAGLPPFAVDSDSMAVVANLDADMVDGHHVTALAQIDGTANAGNLLFVDATYDIGAAGATRPRDLFLSRNAVVGGTLDVTGVSTLRANLLFSADNSHDIGASGATRPRDVHIARDLLVAGDFSPSEWANVKAPAYGAVGDGVADDTTAIQTAIDSGKKVLLPDGVYKITSTLVLSTAGQYFCGLQAPNIVSTNGARILVSSAINAIRVSANGCLLQDFQIHCSASGLNGVILHNAARTTLRRVMARGFTQDGFRFHCAFTTPTGNNNLIKLYDCAAVSCGGIGYNVPNEENDNNGLEFFGCEASACTSHGLLYKGQGMRWIGGIMDTNGGYGIQFGEDADTGFTIDCYVHSPWLEGNTSGGVRGSAKSVRNQVNLGFGQQTYTGNASADDVYIRANNSGGVGFLDTQTVCPIASTATGSQNDWAPGIARDTVITWAGASTLTVTGFASGVFGARILFKNTGSQIAHFAHNSGSSTAGNKLKNIATSANTSVAVGGYAEWVYDGTDWQMTRHDQGAWITPTFAAGDFTAASGNWTVDSGDVAAMRYCLQGNTLHVQFHLEDTDVSATPSYLIIDNNQFGGFTVPALGLAFALVNDAGAGYVNGVLQVHTDGQLRVFKAGFGSSNYTTTAADNTDVAGSVTFPIT